MSSFLAVRVSTERSQQTCRILAKKTVGGEIVDRQGDHEHPGCFSHIVRFTIQHIVCQACLLDVSARGEQLAGRHERLGNLGDDSWGAENRELRAERGEQVTPMTLSPMIGMDGDLVDEGT